MVINNHDDIYAAGLPSFCNVRKIAGIGLPDFSEFVFLISFAVPEVRVSGRFEVIVADKTLDGINAYGSRNKGASNQEFMNLRGIHTWEIIFDTVDFIDCFIIQCP
ncbi:hypothetical protein BLAHAN_06445 [Blautia hansenii DSM 20583]|uniref:Uncharacterized protein n=1 Tax=Blautia hansenii DSM 20583 TaxID=537007 RepID=C9LAJ4_BLAHA|nr:hypothetical protein BLAHAN_06445 [Blautia hansenii DSM 20583]